MFKMNYYQFKWSLFGGTMFGTLSFLAIIIDYYLDVSEIPHSDIIGLVYVGVMLIGGLIMGWRVGVYKEKDMKRAEFLLELGKEFLHDARNHLSIINGYSQIMYNYECPIGMCGKNEDLPKVLEHSRRLSLLIRENIQVIDDFYKTEKRKQQVKDSKKVMKEIRRQLKLGESN